MKLHRDGEWFQLWTMILLWLWQRQVGWLDGWPRSSQGTDATLKGPGEVSLKMLNVLLGAKTFLSRKCNTVLGDGLIPPDRGRAAFF